MSEVPLYPQGRRPQPIGRARDKLHATDRHWGSGEKHARCSLLAMQALEPLDFQCPLSSELGKCQTVKSTFRPWLSGKSPRKRLRCFLIARQRGGGRASEVLQPRDRLKGIKAGLEGTHQGSAPAERSLAADHVREPARIPEGAG